MSLPTLARILPDRVPLPAEDLEAFSQAFRARAREHGLTVRRACRYEAWTLAFLDWCCDDPSRSMGPGQIDAFRTALRDRARLEADAVCEAMDALAFLFGAAQKAGTVLAQAREAAAATESALCEPLSEEEIRALERSWQSGTDGTEDLDGPARTERERNEPVTAEFCIERFQTQLDALHAADVESGEAARRQ